MTILRETYLDNKASSIDYYTLHLSIESYDLLNPYTTRESIPENDNSPDSLLDRLLDNAGINDGEGKTFLSIGMLIGLVIVLALFKVPFSLIIIVEGSLLTTLSFIGWLPMWLPILLVLLIILLAFKHFFGGGTSESD